jgi:hypothetical protein
MPLCYYELAVISLNRDYPNGDPSLSEFDLCELLAQLLLKEIKHSSLVKSLLEKVSCNLNFETNTAIAHLF